MASSDVPGLPAQLSTNGIQVETLSSPLNETAQHQSLQSNGVQSTSLGGRLPPGVIELILRQADPKTFCSLTLLNREWLATSNKRSLYLYHLARCPSYTSGNLDAFKSLWAKDLTSLRNELRKEVDRAHEGTTSKTMDTAEGEHPPEVQDGFRYTHATWKLKALSTTSSTIAPHGESFSFYFSSNGQYLVATSSSRIFVLNVCGPTPVVNRELKVRRRPASCIISNNGETLIILSSDWRIDSYHLMSEESIRRHKLIYLEGPTSALAMSPDCTLLAAAHENCLEFVSLSDDIPSSRRRKISCETAQHLSFSKSGMSLLGTSTDIRNASTTIINAPEETSMDGMGEFMATQRSDQIWLAQLLFPNTFQDCSFAAFLPESDLGHITTLFGYDAPAECFGLLDMSQLKFNGPTVELPYRNTGESIRAWSMPKVTGSGDQVAVGCPGWVQLYDIPSNLEDRPQSDSTLPRRDVGVNEDVSSVTWVDIPEDATDGPSRRLLGILPTQRADQSPIEDTYDSGRLVILDFDRDDTDEVARKREFELSGATLEDLDEVAPDQRENELAEEGFKLAQRAASIKPRLALGRSVTSARNSTRPRRNPENARSVVMGATDEEGSNETPAVEEPYSHSQPRSAQTLQRAATAAAGTRRFHNAPSGALVFRRGDRSEIPDESDADNWVPPPPPYEQSSENELPEHLRQVVQPQSEPIPSEEPQSAPEVSEETDGLQESVSRDSRSRDGGGIDTITDDQLFQPPSPEEPEGTEGNLQGSLGDGRSFTDPSNEDTSESEAAPAPAPVAAHRYYMERPLTYSGSPPSPLMRPHNRYSLQPRSMRSVTDPAQQPQRPASVLALGSGELRRASTSSDRSRKQSQSSPVAQPILPPEPPQLLPSAAQVQSLNRRHSLSEEEHLRQRSNSAPRAAAGARRSMGFYHSGYDRMGSPPPLPPLPMQSQMQAALVQEHIPFETPQPLNPPTPPQESVSFSPPQVRHSPVPAPLAHPLPQAQAPSIPSQGDIPPVPPGQFYTSSSSPQNNVYSPIRQGEISPRFSPEQNGTSQPQRTYQQISRETASNSERSQSPQPPPINPAVTASGYHWDPRRSRSALTPQDATPRQDPQPQANGGKRLSTIQSMSSLLAVAKGQSRSPNRQQQSSPSVGPEYGQPTIAPSQLESDSALGNQGEPRRRSSILFGGKTQHITRLDGYSEKPTEGGGKLKKTKRSSGTKCIVM